MSRTMIAGSRFGSASTGKIINVGLWILQIGTVGMFLMVGFLSSPAIRKWSGYLTRSG